MNTKLLVGANLGQSIHSSNKIVYGLDSRSTAKFT